MAETNGDHYRRGDRINQWILGVMASLLVASILGAFAGNARLASMETSMEYMKDQMAAMQAATAFRYTSENAARDREAQARRDHAQDVDIDQVQERVRALEDRARDLEVQFGAASVP